MEPRYYDDTGQIDYTSIEARALQLRREAIEAFWNDVFERFGALKAWLRHPIAGARAPHWSGHGPGRFVPH